MRLHTSENPSRGENKMKKSIISLLLTTLALFTLTLSSCTTHTRQDQGGAIGAGTGAVLGAVLGQAIGGDTEATMIGAAAGMALGGIAGNQIGKYMDQNERDLRNAIAASEAASIRREQDILTATFKSEAFFDFDSAAIKPGGLVELSRVATVLNKYPQTRIKVAGHTDFVGTEDYNMKLSQRRADAVKNSLIQNGVSAQRIDSIGYGESLPISADNATNRRVEIVIIPVQA